MQKDNIFMTNINDDEYEKILRLLYRDHKEKILEGKIERISIIISILFGMGLVGGLSSMVFKFLLNSVS